MGKYITRDLARRMTCKLETQVGILDKTAFDYVVQLINVPHRIVGCVDCLEWLDGFGNWIESGYNGKATSYEEMAAEFNANCSRKFRKRDGKTVNYCRVLEEYLSFMCLAVNYGKNYTVSRFKAFVKENYKEVLVNG